MSIMSLETVWIYRYTSKGIWGFC